MALWLQYADFCVQRNKFSNARKIFVRALETLPEDKHTAVWARFYGFVCTNVDNKLSLAMLQHQVMPDKFPQPGAALGVAVPHAAQSTMTTTTRAAVAAVPVVAPAVVPVVDHAAGPSASSSLPVSTKTLPSTLQPQQMQLTSVPTTGSSTVSLVDPFVAFVDKTGEVKSSHMRTSTSHVVESMDSAADRGGAVKRGPSDPRLAGDVKRIKQDVAATVSAAEPAAHFLHIPLTLPFIPDCPHLMFDSVADGEAQKQIGNELLERLSDVLSDSAVFEGVGKLRDEQRTRDREMLYRWQDLVGMQMKEGSELFARHVALEMQHGFSDPRGHIALKTQHLEQRREFSSRCQMSQQQFIDICSLDRANALKAQQMSLEKMKIPEMMVTTDPEVIEMQVHWSLRFDAKKALSEKLWREENQQSSAEVNAASIANKKDLQEASASPSRPSDRQRRNSQDSITSSHSTARSSNTGGALRSSSSNNGPHDPRGSRAWGGNGNSRRRDRDPRGGRGRLNKWDIQPQQQSGPPGAVPSQQHLRYNYTGQQAVPRAQEQQQMPMYDREPQRTQVPMQPQQYPRQFQQQQQQPRGALNAPPYDKYGGQQSSMPEQQGYEQLSGTYFSGPQEGPRRLGDSDRFVGQGDPSRGGFAGGSWPPPQQQPFHQQPPQQVMRQYPSSMTADDYRPPYDPTSLSRYGTGVRPGVAADGSDSAPYGVSDPHRGGMPVDVPYYQDLPQQQQQPYHHDDFPAYAQDPYGPPQGEFQQRAGGRVMENYGGAQQQPLPPEMMQHLQPQQRYQVDHLLPAPTPTVNNRRNRRGGRFRR
uniref:Suppressor of forked domain-containing protein n=1 Tax=Hyaloperonospora arabidopsidis (strain Emoy2) TaxID=559515 RepID=M4BZA3_HYAAE